MYKPTKPNIVFVHGIWADGSPFGKVIPTPQAQENAGGRNVTYGEHSLHIARGLPLATTALAAAIFIADTITTVDLAFGTLYAGVVLLAARFRRPSRIVLVAAGCVGLTLLSYAISPHGETEFDGVVNTMIGVGVIGLTTLLVLNIDNDVRQGIRTAEDLRDMQSQLAHVNRVAIMGQLTGSIAHEVAQPIAAAATNARAGLRFLDKSPPDVEEAREALRGVVDDIDRVYAIIGRIRDHFKKRPPRQDFVDLNCAILEVIALARSEMAKQETSIETNLTSGLPSVRGDPVQLQQVVLNLILNAAEAMSSVADRPRKLSISTEQTEAQGVRVAVRDSRSRKVRTGFRSFLHHEIERARHGTVDLSLDH